MRTDCLLTFLVPLAALGCGRVTGPSAPHDAGNLIGLPTLTHQVLSPDRYEIPHTTGPITVDGHCREASWRNAFRSPPFIDATGDSSPHTELRAVADDKYLYVEVFVADNDIESTGDRIELSIGPLRLTLRPKGTVLPDRILYGMDTDDTVDQPGDLDEEWVNELAIPWSMLGSREVPVRVFRIDVGKGKPPHALAWPAAGPAQLHFKAG